MELAAKIRSVFSGAAPVPHPKTSSRRYFDVFGDALTEVVFLRNITIVLTGGVIMLTVGLMRLASKPPLVIKVDNLHEPLAYTNVRQESFVTGHEVRNFAEHFTRNLMGWDLYTLDDDINRAFGMMTPETAVKLKQRLDGLRVAPLVKEHSLRTKIVITEIVVDKDTPHVVRVTVRGTRVAESYDKKDYHRETIFEDVITARKVERTIKTPWGLLVEDWQEKIYKESAQ